MRDNTGQPRGAMINKVRKLGGGSITVNRFSIFARLRVTFDRYFTGQVQHASGYNYAFSDADAAQATTYAALKQGRSL